MPLYGFTPRERHIGSLAAWLEQRQILSARATQATATQRRRQADVVGSGFVALGFVPTGAAAAGAGPPTSRRFLPAVRVIAPSSTSETAVSSEGSGAPPAVPAPTLGSAKAGPLAPTTSAMASAHDAAAKAS